MAVAGVLLVSASLFLLFQQRIGLLLRGRPAQIYYRYAAGAAGGVIAGALLFTVMQRQKTALYPETTTAAPHPPPSLATLSARASVQTEQLQGMLHGIHLDDSLPLLLNYGLDRLQFIADATPDDAADAGIKPLHWRRIHNAAMRAIGRIPSNTITEPPAPSKVDPTAAPRSSHTVSPERVTEKPAAQPVKTDVQPVKPAEKVEAEKKEAPPKAKYISVLNLPNSGGHIVDCTFSPEHEDLGAAKVPVEFTNTVPRGPRPSVVSVLYSRDPVERVAGAIHRAAGLGENSNSEYPCQHEAKEEFQNPSFSLEKYAALAPETRSQCNQNHNMLTKLLAEVPLTEKATEATLAKAKGAIDRFTLLAVHEHVNYSIFAVASKLGTKNFVPCHFQQSMAKDKIPIKVTEVLAAENKFDIELHKYIKATFLKRWGESLSTGFSDATCNRDKKMCWDVTQPPENRVKVPMASLSSKLLCVGAGESCRPSRWRDVICSNPCTFP